MSTHSRLLLLDDDPDMLEIYREILQRLPSKPDVQVVGSGGRAIALCEAEPFQMLITDVSLPKMEGLQLLAVVRRRWPETRTVVMTAAMDEALKKRAYGMGVDLVCGKPSTSKEIETFLANVEGLLRKGEKPAPAKAAGLMDVLRLESLSRNSSVIRCLYGSTEGRVWVQSGEVLDAVAGELIGEPALQAMLAWNGARCDILPGDPTHPRRIFTPLQDFAVTAPPTRMEPGPLAAPPPVAPVHAPAAAPRPVEPAAPAASGGSGLAEATRFPGVTQVLTVRRRDEGPEVDSWGVEQPEEFADWVQITLDQFTILGDILQTGKVNQVDAFSAATRLSLVPRGEGSLCAGFERSVAPEQARETLKLILAQWAS